MKLIRSCKQLKKGDKIYFKHDSNNHKKDDWVGVVLLVGKTTFWVNLKCVGENKELPNEKFRENWFKKKVRLNWELYTIGKDKFKKLEQEAIVNRL